MWSVTKHIHLALRFRCLLYLTGILTISTPFYGQDYAGEYVVTKGRGSTLEIKQSSDGMEVNYQNYTYRCTIEGTVIKGKTEQKNTWFGALSECYQKIMADPQLAEKFKKTITISFDRDRTQGTVHTPKFSCSEEGTPILIDGSSTAFELVLKPNNELYWITKSSIMKCKIDDPSSTKQEFLGGLTKGSDIALNDGGSTIFWIDGLSINAIKFDGSGKLTLSTAEESAFSPHSLMVDSSEKIIFWAEGYSILRYDYTTGNTNRHKILTQQNPVAWLTLDRKNKRIYWTSNYTEIIFQSNYDGTGVEPFVEDDATNIRVNEEEGVLYAMNYKGIDQINLADKNKKVLLKEKNEEGERLLNDPYELFWDKDFKRLYYKDRNKIRFVKPNIPEPINPNPDLGYFGGVAGIAFVTGKPTNETIDPDGTFDIWTLIRNSE